MKLFGFFVAAAFWCAAQTTLQAQVAVQPMRFSLLIDYGKQTVNPDNGTVHFTEGTALVNTANVVRALLYDAFGSSRWTNWNGAVLQREVDMQTGTEGIFLRKGTNRMNVSSNFTSFAGNFSGDLLTQFPGYANNFTPTNPATGVTRVVGDETVTNFVRSHAFYFVALNTSNLKFNFLATGLTHLTNVTGKIDGTTYSRQLEWEETRGVGTVYFNGTTNVFGKGVTPPIISSGNISSGSFNLGRPAFSRIAPPFGEAE